ncbi:hypothetical protein V1477_008691 [Vespula maculifrons]|uniref:Uncharacterized protein n=1 Tax=Vespula maculifrons TaxID=7453 RepID=A0ABD2CDS0_VESMC
MLSSKNDVFETSLETTEYARYDTFLVELCCYGWYSASGYNASVRQQFEEFLGCFLECILQVVDLRYKQ